MIYMGQEFNVQRDRNLGDFTWPPGRVREVTVSTAGRAGSRAAPALPYAAGRRLRPRGDGRFAWTLGPWMDQAHGGGRKVVGWRLRPTGFAYDAMVALLNFEPVPVLVDLELGLAVAGSSSPTSTPSTTSPRSAPTRRLDPTALHSGDGRFTGFALPSSSGFLYKWERS